MKERALTAFMLCSILIDLFIYQYLLHNQNRDTPGLQLKVFSIYPCKG